MEQYIPSIRDAIMIIGMFALVWRALTIAHDLAKIVLQNGQLPAPAKAPSVLSSIFTKTPLPPGAVMAPVSKEISPAANSVNDLAPKTAAKEITPPSDNFNACMAFVWPEEGGFSNDPQDHGGPTNLGVTEPDLVRAGMPATIDDIKALTKPIAAARIYRPFYWNAMHCDELPRGVDLCVFDLGINAGIHEAAKLLQRDVGVATDGVIGPLTIAAVKTKAPADIIRTFTEERLSFYQSLKQFDRFGRDWTKRTNDCHAAALKMAGGAVAPAPLAKT